MPHARRERERTTSASGALPRQGNGLGYTSVGRRKGSGRATGEWTRTQRGNASRCRNAVVVRPCVVTVESWSGWWCQAVPRHGATPCDARALTSGRACRHAGRAERGPVRGWCRTRGKHPGPEAPAARSRALAQGMTSCPRSRPKACRSVPGSPGGVDVGGTPRVPLPRCQGPPAPGPGSGRSPGRRMLPIRWTRPRPRRGWGPARGHRPSAGAAPAPQAVPRPARSGRTP